MSILQILEKDYYYSVEKIKNTNNRNKKREYITELVLDLQKADIKFSQRELSSCLGVSRQLIKSILDTIRFKMNFMQYLIYFLLLFFVKIETRGRKKVEINNPKIITDIELICENTKHIDKRLHDEIIYTDVTLGLVQEKLEKDYNYDYVPSQKTISRIMKEKLGFKITRVKKDVIFKRVKETDDIFANVFSRIKEIKSSSNNILAISIDDKVAKYIDILSGMGKSWLEKHTLDHDTNPTFIAKPFGIMDLKDKVVRVFCTISNSTANFKADCIEEYLIKKIEENLNIKKLFIFLDNGPENSSRRKLWLYRIINLSIKYNIQIELVYYPPYCSKYNLIEHFWGALQKHWSGMVIDNLEKLIGAINSCTWSGKKARGYLRSKVYNKGEKVDEEELQELINEHVSYPNETIKKWSLIITVLPEVSVWTTITR